MDENINDPRELYNIISVKNITTDDFSFKVDGQPYMIAAGETRNFPKFMATLAVKHLIDKIANDTNPSGDLNINKDWREARASEIVVGEQKYEKPKIVTDEEIVEEMNTSDLDSVLDKKPVEAEVKEEVKETNEDFVGLKPKKPKGRPKGNKNKLPPRKDMISYAKNKLKLNVDDAKTKQAWKKMSDKELYKELGM